MQKLINFTGTMNISAGLFLLVFWFLYATLLPYQKLDNTLSILVTDRDWVWVNLFGIAGAVFGLLGLVGIILKAADTISTIGLIGFVMAFIGTILLTTTLVWDTLLWPILVNHDTTLLDFTGPIYTSKTFVPFFMLTGILYSVGYVVLGIAMAKSGVHPYWGCVLIAVGAPLFGLGPMFGKMQVYPRTIGITLLCVGLIYIGSLMITSKPDVPVMPVSIQQ